jgi:hypothetical protein
MKGLIDAWTSPNSIFVEAKLIRAESAQIICEVLKKELNSVQVSRKVLEADNGRLSLSGLGELGKLINREKQLSYILKELEPCPPSPP